MHQELLFFCRTFLAGVLITAGYDMLRIFRNVIPHRDFWVNLEDLLYWCAAGGALFFVIYRENDGTIRIYALAGIILGVLAYHEGPSRLLVKYISIILSKIKTLLILPLKPLNVLRKRLKFPLRRVRIFLSKQKPMRKVRKSKNEKKKEEKPTEQIRHN